MIYIKRIYIEGFKKFNKIDISFNEKKNLLVGDNGSGKSTILEAIDLALNFSMYRFDLSLLKILFNSGSVKKFNIEKNLNSLPRILIQIFFGGMDKNPEYMNFYGPLYENSKDIEDYGVEFKAEIDRTMISELTDQINQGYIPYEYYRLSSMTFANMTYRPGTSNVLFFLINSSNSNMVSINSYSKMMFKALPKDIQTKVKNIYSSSLPGVFDKIKTDFPKDSPNFSYNIEKTSLENIIEIYKDDLPLTALGEGFESIIKIKQLIKSHQKATIIGIEEPENHLSYSSMNEMIEIIHSNNVDKQLILTSHSSRIATGLGLNNIIGLSESTNNLISFAKLDNDTAKYFRALPSDSLLQFILSKKVILVEGAAELLYMPLFYNKIYGSSMEENGISCISVNGLSFKHFVKIAQIKGIKTCVITDNDGDITKVKNFENELKKIYNSEKFDVFYADDKNNPTFEVCLYNDNKDLINKTLKIQENSEYKHIYSNGNKYLGRMLNDKTGTALELVNNETFKKDLKVPSYIESAIKFIHE